MNYLGPESMAEAKDEFVFKVSYDSAVSCNEIINLLAKRAYITYWHAQEDPIHTNIKDQRLLADGDSSAFGVDRNHDILWQGRTQSRIGHEEVVTLGRLTYADSTKTAELTLSQRLDQCPLSAEEAMRIFRLSVLTLLNDKIQKKSLTYVPRQRTYQAVETIDVPDHLL